MNNNIYYMIFNIEELNLINFNEVLQTSQNSIRKSFDQTKTFVKWIGQNIPISIQNLKTKEGPYSHTEILNILKTSEWSDVSQNLL